MTSPAAANEGTLIFWDDLDRSVFLEKLKTSCGKARDFRH